MGLIILPFFLGALVIGIISIIKSIKLLKLRSIGLKEVFLGFITSLTIFGLISFIYIIESNVWGLSPGFRLPIFMIFIPFAIHLINENSTNSKMKYFSTILLLSVGITAILGVIFNDAFFGILDYLGVEKHY